MDATRESEIAQPVWRYNKSLVKVIRPSRALDKFAESMIAPDGFVKFRKADPTNFDQSPTGALDKF